MRNQQTDESISDYIVTLKKLSIHCNYEEFLNRALRDRFVCGLNNVKIQNKLLNTSSLTFDTACNTACKSGASGRQNKGRVQNLAVDDQTPVEDGIQSSDDELGILGLFATTAAQRVSTS